MSPLVVKRLFHRPRRFTISLCNLGVQPEPAGGNKTLRTLSAGIQSSAKTVLSIYLIPLFHNATLLLRTPKHFLNFSFFEEKMRKSGLKVKRASQRLISATTQPQLDLNDAMKVLSFQNNVFC